MITDLHEQIKLTKKEVKELVRINKDLDTEEIIKLIVKKAKSHLPIIGWRNYKEQIELSFEDSKRMIIIVIKKSDMGKLLLCIASDGTELKSEIRKDKIAKLLSFP